jgi:hypothetical protein
VALNQLREYIARQILPIQDLGLKKQPTAGLHFPDDLPPNLAVLSGQGPVQPRLVATDNYGKLLAGNDLVSFALLPLTTTAVDGQTGIQYIGRFAQVRTYLLVTDLTGAVPTLDVYLDESPDSGVTWYQSIELGPGQITAVTSGPPYPGNVINTLSMYNTPFSDAVRIRWVFVGTSVTFAVLAVGK